MDRDLESVQQARELVARAAQAAEIFARADQAHVDRVVTAMGEAAEVAAEELARKTVDETRMGRYEDKVLKNRFGAVDVRQYILPLRTCGVIREHPEERVVELAVPMGVVAALIPTTNPTSTVIYKGLIAVKARNAIVFSPHPRAARCSVEAARVLQEAATKAGAPKDLILCISTPAVEGTNELMRHRHTAVILATGGTGMVRAAYSSGKPAFGVGPGNVPAIVERTANVQKAVADVVAGKCFDYGLLCSAENSLICDSAVEAEVREELGHQRALFVTDQDRVRLQRLMQDPRTGGINTEIVGLAAPEIARRAGIGVPNDTRVLVTECGSVGPEEFFSREKLSPVLAFYVEDGWERCCDRSIELLHFGGIGHTLVIHSNDETVIRRFFEEKPAFRILVNTVASVGAVGYTTGLAPAMTLGPGTMGGSATSDNITPLHLINIKRLAYETRPFVGVDAPERRPAVTAPVEALAGAGAREGELASDIARVVERFLAERRAGRQA
jgi:acetaldehyde dehydrogenase (acetylating)